MMTVAGVRQDVPCLPAQDLPTHGIRLRSHRPGCDGRLRTASLKQRLRNRATASANAL